MTMPLKLRAVHRGTFHPDNRVRMGWDLLLVLCALWSLTEAPVRWAFGAFGGAVVMRVPPAVDAAVGVVNALQPLVPIRLVVFSTSWTRAF